MSTKICSDTDNRQPWIKRPWAYKPCPGCQKMITKEARACQDCRKQAMLEHRNIQAVAKTSQPLCWRCNKRKAPNGRLICQSCRQEARHQAKAIVDGMRQGEVYRMYFKNVRSKGDE